MLTFSPSTRRDLLTAFAASWMFLPTVVGHADDAAPSAESDNAAIAEVTSLIRKAIAVRDDASNSIATARGSGRYNVTVIDKAMNVVRKERASFRLARTNGHHFIQFRYQEGMGYGAADVYARIVLTDGKKLYESLFCQRFRPTGAKATVYDENFEPATLQPLVEISGNLAEYYGFIHLLLKQKDGKLSLRDEDGIKVVTSTDEKNNAAAEFWIDPRQNLHIVRYRIVIHTDKTPVTVLDVRKEWRQSDKMWDVHRCVVRAKYREDGEIYKTEETELVFDTFERLSDVPAGVFTAHALGLPNDSPIWQSETRERERYLYDPKFDLSTVEKIVGTLPTVLPPK